MSVEPSRRAAGVRRTLVRRFFDAAPADAINLGLGQPDVPTPASIAAAGVRAIRDGHTGYTTTAGLPELRRRIAGRYAGFCDGFEQVTVHSGSQQALYATLLTLIDPGQEVLIPDPGYPGYAPAVRLAGGLPVAYPLRASRGFQLDVDEIAARLRPGCGAVLLCNPGNPTGAVQGGEALGRLVDLLAERDVPWVSDEVYDGFVYEGRATGIWELSRNGVVVSGLSKSCSMTGWRVGWSVAPEPLARRVTAVHQYLVTCSCSISQHAALAAFEPAGVSEAAEIVRRFRRRREVMARGLSRIDGVGFEPPAGSFYFFVDVSRYGASLALAERILERANVVTIPGVAFGEGGEGFLRLSFAAPGAKIREGLARIAECLAAG
jgi:aspartate/methionine/tyrosine aminotransferase